VKSSAIYTPNAYEVICKGSENGRVVTIGVELNPNNPVVILRFAISSDSADRGRSIIRVM